MYTSLKIENFKSIKSLDLPLKRVNVLIGEPNTGKSNILEACALMGTGYLCSHNEYLHKALRFNHVRDLFRDKTPEDQPISLTLEFDQPNEDRIYCQSTLFFNLGTSEGAQWLTVSKELINYLDAEERLIAEGQFAYDISTSDYFKPQATHREKVDFYVEWMDRNPIKYYNFTKFDLSKSNKQYSQPKLLLSLESPSGTNLIGLLKNSVNLLEHVGHYFASYGYKITINMETNQLQFVKPYDFSYMPFDINLAPDTFLRMIYYDLALRTNKDAFLLLEEPEAYSYPTYVSELAYEIANDEHNNQYLLTTHSPHMIYKLIDELSYEELNIVGVYFEDFQTKVKVFTEDELGELLDMGYDLFFSLPSVLSRTTEPA
jgi:AAA15 family ATPase/GTPase